MEITKEEIKEKLVTGYSIFVAATAMITGGSHRWWYEDGDMKCFGSGPGWRDQNDVVSFDLDGAVKHLYENRESIYDVDHY